MNPARSAFLVGAGVILVLGGLALSFKIFNTKDEPVALASNASAARSPHFPPEVVKLVTDTEVAFQQDDFKTARTDVAALQQIAPDHPRLPFFESLLKRLEATPQGSKSGSGRMFLRHTSPPAASGGANASATQRRQPDIVRDTASAAAVTPAASTSPTSTTLAPNPSASAKDATPSSTPIRTAATTSTTFSGRTLEESGTDTSAQPVATPSQAMATPVPRRPGSAASAADTQEPHLIQHIAADYPIEAARKGIEGSVEVRFTISSQGKVSDVTVVSAVPSDIFNRAATAAVRRWKYEPKLVNGVPVEAHQQLRLQFKLDPKSE